MSVGLKPIDEAFLRKVSEISGRNESERTGSLETDKPRRPSRSVVGEGSRSGRNVVDASVSSGGVVAVARDQGHVVATGETLSAPARNRWSKVDRITGETGKSVEGGRESEGHIVVGKRGNARGAKVPCCSTILPSTCEAGAR